jgi:hypothetical protein
MRGKLKITSDETHAMLFTSDDGKTTQAFSSCAEHNKKWFCESSYERSHAGIPATWNPETNQLMTDDWHNRRTAEFLGRGDYQLSHKFT